MNEQDEDTDEQDDSDDEDVDEAGADEEDEEDDDEFEENYDGGGGELKQLVEYIARAVVNHPDEVVVSEHIDDRRHVIRLDVAESDMGKVIGRGGRVAEAMRSLLKVAAVKSDTRVLLDIGD
jgi:predicted RNA-binding protein YlqC (UPF0109 family)